MIPLFIIWWAVREINGVIDLVVGRMKQLGFKVPPAEPQFFSHAQTLITPGSLELTDQESGKLTQLVAQLWFEGEHHKWITAVGGRLLRTGIAADVVGNFTTQLAKEFGCPMRCWATASRQVLDLTKANRHVPGLSTLIEIAEAHNREDLIQQLLRFNKQLHQAHKVDSCARKWLSNHGYGG